MRILLAVYGSSGSETAIQEIVRRPWGSNSELKVITVAEIPIMPANRDGLARAGRVEPAPFGFGFQQRGSSREVFC